MKSNNDINVKYLVLEFLTFPDSAHPKYSSGGIHTTFGDAKNHANNILDTFEEQYGVDFIEYVQKEGEIGWASNGDVDCNVYIINIGNLKSTIQ